jgi:hypothetical protein
VDETPAEGDTVSPLYPSLFQINTRVWLTELSRRLERPATLDDIPDAELDRLAHLGFDWIWMLSVWQTGPAGRAGFTAIPSGAGVRGDSADLREEDIAGSGFAITGYTSTSFLGRRCGFGVLRDRCGNAA